MESFSKILNRFRQGMIEEEAPDEVLHEIVMDILEDRGSYGLLRGLYFKELRKEVNDVWEDIGTVEDKGMQLLVLLRVMFFVSIFRDCKGLPMIDVDPVDGVTVCFPRGLLNISFTTSAMLVFEAESLEAAKDAKFNMYSISSFDDIDAFENLSFSMQRYVEFPKNDESKHRRRCLRSLSGAFLSIFHIEEIVRHYE